VQVEQTNGITVKLHLQQRGEALTGGAMHPTHKPRKLLISGETVDVSGTADGQLAGHRFNVTVYWGRGEAVGIYSGSINAQGRLTGVTYDRRNPNSRAEWFARDLMQCQNRPAKTLGKRV
jgi:hypothetical protein